MLAVWNVQNLKQEVCLARGTAIREERSYFVSEMNFLPSDSILSSCTFSPRPGAAGANGTSRAPLFSASWSHAPGGPREAARGQAGDGGTGGPPRLED